MTALSRRLFLSLPAAAAAAGLIRPALAVTETQQMVERSRIAFLDIITDNNYVEMRDYVKRAQALVIFPELVKGAFVFGAEGGSGVLVGRGPKGWSDPAFYTLASGSFGLQIGVQAAALVLTIMTSRGLDGLINNQFKIGGNVDVAVGPMGKGVSAATTFSGDAFSFAKTVGAYAGFSLDGAGVFKRDSWNAEYYAAGAQPADIVINRKYTNHDAQVLVDTLAPY
jgi:lipid-binding SYLF domain-containing protein